MELNNLSVSMGLEIKDICFTSSEWVKFADAVNIANAQALYAGLFIGATVGVFGFFCALKYMESKHGKS